MSTIFASKKFLYSLFANDWIIMLFGFYFLKKAASSYIMITAYSNNEVTQTSMY